MRKQHRKVLSASKIGTKRIGGKVMLTCQKNQMERKETTVSKIVKKQKSKIESKNKKTLNDENQMKNAIKSYGYEQKTDNNEHQQMEKQSVLNSQSLQNSSYLRSAQTNLKHAQVQEMFKQLKRKMMAESEFINSKKQKQNCFYNTLKHKLKEQMFKIEEKQDYDRINFTIEGCNANLHTKKSSWLLSENKRHRPQTAINSPQANDCSFNSKKRPLSERAKSYKSLQKSRSLNNLKNKTIDVLNNKRSQRHTARQPPTQTQNSPQITIIQTCQQSLTQRNRHRRNRSQDNFKINKILGDCDYYSEGQHILKDNMKIFQFYCKKMDARFEKVSHQLDLLQIIDIK